LRVESLPPSPSSGGPPRSTPRESFSTARQNQPPFRAPAHFGPPARALVGSRFAEKRGPRCAVVQTWFEVQDLGFKVWAWGLGVLECVVWGVGFGLKGSGFGVWGLGFGFLGLGLGFGGSGLGFGV